MVKLTYPIQWFQLEENKNYFISNYGEIKDLNDNMINCYCNKDGYQVLLIKENKIFQSYCIHQLVAKYFIPNVNNLPQIDHFDRNKNNNFFKNLRYVTVQTNAINRNKPSSIKGRPPSSKYKGISKENNGWRARIYANGKSIFSANAYTELDAVKKRHDHIINNNLDRGYIDHLYSETLQSVQSVNDK